MNRRSFLLSLLSAPMAVALARNAKAAPLKVVELPPLKGVVLVPRRHAMSGPLRITFNGRPQLWYAASFERSTYGDVVRL